MGWIRVLLSRFCSLFGRRRLDCDLDEELRAHIELATAENVRLGMPAETARTQAFIRFGGIAQTTEVYRVQRGMPFMEALACDLRFGFRQLRKSPSFTLTFVLTLAVGIGGLATVYSIVEALLLRPLRFVDSDRLVRLHEGVLHQFEQADLPAPDVIRFAHDNHSFTQVAGFVRADYEVSGAGAPFRATAERVSASLFPTLRVQPFLGRAFTQNEDENSTPVAVISDLLWRERFRSDPKVIGSTIDLDRRAYTIIGVMPLGFVFPLDAGRLSHRDLWVPMSFTPNEKKDETDNFQYGAIARLRTGVTLAQAQSDVDRMLAAIEAEIPPQYGIHLTSKVRLLQEETTQRVRPVLNALLAAAGLILLIACANLANLQLIRATGRRREFGMRTALGAVRSVILRQLIVESLLLSAIGGLLALALTGLIVRFAPILLPDSFPRANEIAMHWPVFLVTAVSTVVAGLVCGLAPAMASVKTDMLGALREASHYGGQSRSLNRVRGALVGIETALAMLLLVASSLLLRSFEKMLETDPGFQPEHVLTASLTLPDHAYPTQPKVDAFYKELLGQLVAIPQVRSVGAATNIPVVGIGSDRSLVPEGYAPREGRRWLSGSNYFVLGDYFGAMRIPLIEGRFFTDVDDQPDAPLVAIVSQSAARQYWPHVDAIGRRFRMGGNPDSKRPLITVVGVVGDVRQGPLDQAVYPQMYEPFEQSQGQYERQVQQAIGTYRSLHLVLKTEGDPLTMQPVVEKIVHRLDPMLALADTRSMDEVVSATETSRRFNTVILAVFSSIALALALLGIYGMLAYSVSERTREIAIRMALGATREVVLWNTLRAAVTLAAAGIAGGVAASLGLTRFLGSLLYAVKPLDIGAIVGAAALLLLCAAIAGWIPARRAASVDPMQALRIE